MLILQLALGLALLVAGGEALVRGATALAARLGVSPLMIGLTVVGFGTSTPELVTSLQAAFAGAPGIAVGNVVGSNIANILLILGVAAVLMPFAVSPGAFRRDGAALVLASLACLVVVLMGTLSRPAGLVLVGGLAVYLVLAYRAERQPVAERVPVGGVALAASGGPGAITVEPAPAPGPLGVSLGLAAGGIVLTILGAHLLVGSAVALAGAWGVSDAVIGLTVVAVGTSLPELVTAVVAAWKREGDIAFGNVVGSNLYNVLGILGVTALVHPIPVPASIAAFDIWVMLAATGALVAVAVTGWRVTRAEGAALLAAYAAYVAVLVAGATGGA
jgi:cation:H+ antiporter